MNRKQPFVSIIIPCFNEEKYIARCLDGLLTNDYNKKALEIVVVDGMSTDRTRDIVNKYTKNYNFIRMIDNPWIIKPIALNLGIKATTSDIVMRIDAHAVYASNYISRCVEGLLQYNADNIGGIRETHIEKSLLGKAIGLITSHPFAAGNAHYRVGSDEVRKVDTVFCGCYRREVFEKIGYFNEKLIRTQDREFNARLVNFGGTIILDPAIRCTYFPRTTLKKYCEWNYDGAYWVYYARRFTNTRMLSLRNIIPPGFVMWHFFVLLALIFSSSIAWLIALPIIIYWLLAIFFSIKEAWKQKSIMLAPIMLILFAITHYGYGIAGIHGFIKSIILGKEIVQ